RLGRVSVCAFLQLGPKISGDNQRSVTVARFFPRFPALKSGTPISIRTGREGSMRRAVICVTAGPAAVAIGVWLNYPTSNSATEISVSKATMTPAISIWGIHNQARFLPVQQIEDQSFVFTEAPR